MAGSFFVAPDRAAVGKNNLKGKDQENCGFLLASVPDRRYNTRYRERVFKKDAFGRVVWLWQ